MKVIAWYVPPPMIGSSWLSPVKLNSTTVRPSYASLSHAPISANAIGSMKLRPPISVIFCITSASVFDTENVEPPLRAEVKVLPNSAPPITAIAATDKIVYVRLFILKF